MDIYEKYKKLEDLPVKTIVKEPESMAKARGVIQFVHGMCEHKNRYYQMADYFCKQGFVCVLSDLRGHGENVEYLKDLGYFGENGADLLVEDVHGINAFIHNNYPDLKVILVAHSLGSIISRAYLKKYDLDVDFVFFSGAPSDSLGKYPGLLLAEIFSIIFDEKDNSKIIDRMFYKRLEKKFEQEGKNSWICSDKDVVEKYNDDESCQFTFTINGYNALFRLMCRIYSTKKWAVKNDQLPIYFVVGSEDVCVGSEELLKKQAMLLKKVGYKNVTYKIFEGMRHEVFNETNHEKVWEYMLKKLEAELI